MCVVQLAAIAAPLVVVAVRPTYQDYYQAAATGFSRNILLNARVALVLERFCQSWVSQSAVSQDSACVVPFNSSVVSGTQLSTCVALIVVIVGIHRCSRVYFIAEVGAWSTP